MVAELSEKLPPLKEKQKQWAIENVIPRKAWTCKKEAWCNMCGGVFHAEQSMLGVSLCEGKDNEIVCPHCGRTLEYEVNRKRKSEIRRAFNVVTVCGGMQVVRSFEVFQTIRKGGQPYYWFGECVQNWLDIPSGKVVIMARSRAMNAYYCDVWAYTTPITIKARRSSHLSYGVDYYNIYADVCPNWRVHPILKRNGYRGQDLEGITTIDLLQMLVKDYKVEVLLKNKQYSLLKTYEKRGAEHWDSVKIAIRNKYIVKDAVLWHDLLRALEYFGKDLRNACYVCPKDLKKSHDYWMKKRRADEAEKKRREDARLAEERQQSYLKDKGRYLGICFGNENICVTVIQSVADMVEEGEKMHHCVGSYWDKKNSLILSAKDRNGKRIETVEVNLGTFKVVQSRGVCNENTPFHNEIINLVEKNMNLIREAV